MSGSTSSPQSPTPSPERLRAVRWGLVGVWALAALVHLSLGPGARTRIWPLGYMVLEILATASLGYRAWKAPGGARLAWGLLAASAFLEVPNLVLTFLQTLGEVAAWASETTSLLSLTTGLLALAGVLSFPSGARQGGRTFRRRALDGLIFAASILFLLWVMGVQGSLNSAAQGMGLRVIAAYLNAALLGGGLVYMTSYHPDRFRGPLGWLAGSALAWLVALSCWTLAGLPLVPAAEAWIPVAGAIPLFQGLAAWSFQRTDVSGVAEDGEHRLARLLPYVPVGAALVVLALLLPRAPLHLMRGAFGIFLAMVVLILLRQIQAVEDLQAARMHLEARVRQRTEALERAQETLLRTERLNTLALMGAGLAHDLNNLLCVMKSTAELAVLGLEEGQPPQAGDLHSLASTADRASKLTGRLMAFVRREVEERAPMDLGRAVKEMEASLRLLLPRTVDMRIDVPADEALIVQGSRHRLEQMLVNLVANARDAMPEGGRLAIQAGPGGPDRTRAVIEVADTGVGMTPETRARIFEPFFTTKPPGKGTGLGLASLKALVEEDGGCLDVDSAPGQGARFRILLPRVD